MKDKIIAKSNVANKIRNTTLSRKKGLMPLFELISNSIHSILERTEAKSMKANEEGKILITLIRTGNPQILESIPDNDNYPIKAIKVQDNGIGLNDANLTSFIEADSDHKLEIGGKGIGRFVCLKAFKYLEISSIFGEKGRFKKRSLSLRNTKQGFENYVETDTDEKTYQTTCSLFDFFPEYQRNTPKKLSEITDAIITHFQLYFITNQIPHIIISNQNGVCIDLNHRYSISFSNKVQEKEFFIGEDRFMVYLSESNSSKSHRLHFCAHNRSVIEEWLGKRIIDLGKKPVFLKDTSPFYYAAFIVSELLDGSVNNERTNFCFPTNEEEEEEEEETEEITLSKIRRHAVNTIESLITDYLTEVQTEKVEAYRTVIDTEMPQYRAVLNRRPEQVKKLQSGLSKQNLDIELYKIEADWKSDVKKQGVELIEKKIDITSLDEYHILYEKYLTGLNEIGQSELARYVTHRKSVIDLLDYLTSKENDEDKFANEDLVHSLFFPIRSTSDIIPHDKQNLWMIDERLSYHSYLASDKFFSNLEHIEVSENQNDRPDILILSNAFAFVEDKEPPYNSITIIEFKKPERDNYVDNDDKKNPVDQVERYIEDLLNGKVTNRKGRTINITKDTPFYVYIISDLTPSLVKILERRDFYKTPDGQGYYTFKSRRYNGYIEVMTFDKVRSDAKKRNQILFDKLGLPIE